MRILLKASDDMWIVVLSASELDSIRRNEAIVEQVGRMMKPVSRARRSSSRRMPKRRVTRAQGKRERSGKRETDSRATSRKGRARATYPAAVRDILRKAGRPMVRGEIFEELKKRGDLPGTKDPKKGLGVHLATMKRVYRNTGKGYVLVDQGAPAARSEVDRMRALREANRRSLGEGGSMRRAHVPD